MAARLGVVRGGGMVTGAGGGVEVVEGNENGSGRAEMPTIDDDSGGGTLAAGHDVLGHAGVVARVSQPRMLDDEVVVGRDEDVGVGLWVEQLLVPLPLHLSTGHGDYFGLLGQNSVVKSFALVLRIRSLIVRAPVVQEDL